MEPNRRKQLSLVFALLTAFFLLSQIPQSLVALRTTVDPETYLTQIFFLLYLMFLPIAAGWYSSRITGGIFFTVLACGASIFGWAVAHSSYFFWPMAGYLLLLFLLYRIEQRFEELLAVSRVESEKCMTTKNDLEVEYRHKGESISIFFEKYSTYYNLRKLAEDFAGLLSLHELSQLVVGRSLDFIPRGDGAFLTLAYPSEESLRLTAFKNLTPRASSKRKQGDLFDHWVLRNRKRLLIIDTQKDFRFSPQDVKSQGEEIRSLISAPLLHEGKVLGTLRLQSQKPEVFAPDDLRLLDAISTLASAALSNAMLFEKTQELAIRDSLTGLYIQRYFFERLHDEHRRVLRGGHQLSLLMCDLDHFKAANDRWGHGAGDLMLVKFSEILREKVTNGLIARYGGEEFAVLLPELTKEKAAVIGEQIRQAMESFPFTIRRERIQMTVSIGVAGMPQDTLDDEELIRKADEALYQAKREGRNRVIICRS